MDVGGVGRSGLRDLLQRVGDGPQNSLWQYTGVENSARIGWWAASAAAIVSRCSSGSGTRFPLWARESIASGSTFASANVRFLVSSAFWPGAGSAGPSETPNCVVRVCGCAWPAGVNDNDAVHTPGDGNVTCSSW